MERSTRRQTRETRSELEARIHRLEFTVDWPPGHAAAYLVDGPEPVLVDRAFLANGEPTNSKRDLRRMATRQRTSLIS